MQQNFVIFSSNTCPAYAGKQILGDLMNQFLHLISRLVKLLPLFLTYLADNNIQATEFLKV
jgi:hypothetical protein